jgi:hypothetical protein
MAFNIKPLELHQMVAASGAERAGALSAREPRVRRRSLLAAAVRSKIW